MVQEVRQDDKFYSASDSKTTQSSGPVSETTTTAVGLQGIAPAVKVDYSGVENRGTGAKTEIASGVVVSTRGVTGTASYVETDSYSVGQDKVSVQMGGGISVRSGYGSSAPVVSAVVGMRADYDRGNNLGGYFKASVDNTGSTSYGVGVSQKIDVGVAKPTVYAGVEVTDNKPRVQVGLSRTF